jgi:RNA ligase (TIGR02306 family)
MSTFSCQVIQVESVEHHPNADRLSVVGLRNLGYTAISAKLDDGSHRYKPGDHVVYIPTAAVLPVPILKSMGFWNETTNIGTLAGKQGDRVKPLRLRGIYSEGILMPVRDRNGSLYITDDVGDSVKVFVGDNVAHYLGITKYEPPIPTHLSGEVANIGDHCVKYDFERLESVPDIFSDGELIVATEKLHGTFCAIVYVPNLNHPEMFGTSGNIIVHSKGLGSQGLAFKNNDANAQNLYVRTLRHLLDHHELEYLLAKIGNQTGKRVAILGEIFGKGVQDLDYGTVKPEFRMFDMLIGNKFLNAAEIADAVPVNFPRVPTLYSGPFDLLALTEARDGKTTVGGTNIREGIVVKSAESVAQHPVHGRKIAKMISPAYLLRKNDNATEYT